MMKRLSILLVLLVCASQLSAVEEPLRVWTPSKGPEIKARLIKNMGGRVTLRKEDSQKVGLYYTALSAEDKAYLSDVQKRKREAFLNRGKTSRKVIATSSAKIQADWMSTFELGVIEETNLARTDPAGYAKHLEKYRSQHRGNNVFATPRGNLLTQEGVKAVDEAIDFLKEAKPLSPIMPSRGLSLAAKAHADDIGPVGITGHTGTDKSTSQQRIERQGRWKSTIGENISFGSHTARDVVVSLIIDDGVPSRGHRINIFTPAFHVAGVAEGKHKQYGSMCVIDYAGGFSD